MNDQERAEVWDRTKQGQAVDTCEMVKLIGGQKDKELVPLDDKKSASEKCATLCSKAENREMPVYHMLGGILKPKMNIRFWLNRYSNGAI